MTVLGSVVPDTNGKPGNYCLMWGTVTLGGTNPTPVALAGYVTALDFGVANIIATSTPGDDPVLVCTSVSTTTLNIEAYKNNGTDPTLLDSTDSSTVIAWFAAGPAK